MLEKELTIKQQQVETLQCQQNVLQELEPEKQEAILSKKAIVEER